MNDSLIELKRMARSRAKLALADLTADTSLVREYSERAAAYLFSSDIYRDSTLILLFLSVGGEIDTKPIIDRASADGKLIAVPRISAPDERGVRHMDFFMLTAGVPFESQTVPGAFGIREPSESCAIVRAGELPADTLVLTPGYAFTPDGARLGKGGGYYDRFFERTKRADGKRGPVFTGFCFSVQVFPDVPEGAHDFRVSYILTERGLFPTARHVY